MTGALSRERRGAAAWIVVLAALSAIGAWLIVGWDAAKLAPPPAIGLVAPDFAARPQAAQVIIVTTRDGAYRISRNAKGWSMTDRGAYPIKADRMKALLDGLGRLSAVRPLTRDPKKHARLGVDDPVGGGSGVRLQVQDAQGALLVNLIVSSFDDRLYLRRGGDDQVWAANEGLPNLRQASAWLDLTPYRINLDRIGRVDVAPAMGLGYAIIRPDVAVADFVLARPNTGKALAGGVAPNAVAAGLGALKPIDVAPAPSITGAPNARVVLSTLDGLALDAELFARGSQYWVKLGARAGNETVAAEAQALNARIGPWAYGLSALDYAALGPPLAEALTVTAPVIGVTPSLTVPAATAAPAPQPRPRPAPAPAPEPPAAEVPSAPAAPDPTAAPQ